MFLNYKLIQKNMSRVLYALMTLSFCIVQDFPINAQIFNV